MNLDEIKAKFSRYKMRDEPWNPLAKCWEWNLPIGLSGTAFLKSEVEIDPATKVWAPTYDPDPNETEESYRKYRTKEVRFKCLHLFVGKMPNGLRRTKLSDYSINIYGYPRSRWGQTMAGGFVEKDGAKVWMSDRQAFDYLEISTNLAQLMDVVIE